MAVNEGRRQFTIKTKRTTEFFTFLDWQNCCSALNFWAARQRRPTVISGEGLLRLGGEEDGDATGVFNEHGTVGQIFPVLVFFSGLLIGGGGLLRIGSLGGGGLAAGAGGGGGGARR